MSCSALNDENWCPSQNTLYIEIITYFIFWACVHVFKWGFWQLHLPFSSSHNPPLLSSWVWFIMLPIKERLQVSTLFVTLYVILSGKRCTRLKGHSDLVDNRGEITSRLSQPLAASKPQRLMGWWRDSVCQQGFWERGRGVKEGKQNWRRVHGPDTLTPLLFPPAPFLMRLPALSNLLCSRECCSVYLTSRRGFGFPQFADSPSQPFRVHTQAYLADDKALLSLSAEPRSSQHALPSARHLPGLAHTQPWRPPHYSLWQGFMTQQLRPDLFWEPEQMLKSVAMTLLSNRIWLRKHKVGE